MISYERALETVLAAARQVGRESVPLSLALGRYLSQDLFAAFDSPLFDNSAVDGYAVRAVDLAGATPARPVVLRITGESFAGDDVTARAIGPGEAAKTMTGAGIVAGADSVVMKEDVVVTGAGASFAAPTQLGSAVRKRASEYGKGDLLVGHGTKCSPSVLALVASQGLAEIVVGRPPRLGLVVTGSELVKPGEPLAAGQIYESNSVALAAAAASLTGASPAQWSVGDDEAETRRAFLEAVDACDVVVFSGGASVGEKDLVRSVLLSCGVQEEFWRINMKPGKPVFFGMHTNGARVFALPGNPVSAQVTFELLVSPLVRKMSGAGTPGPLFEKAYLGSCIKRAPGRKEFVRSVSRNENGRLVVEPLARQGSHMASGLAAADRLTVVEADVDCLEAGTLVETVQLRWSVMR
jgi:molybdenum cofactor synthesis domain-containing protein